MKLSIITNYTSRGYVNEQFIFNKLCSTLDIPSNDIFDFNTTNTAYNINENYTHVLVLIDYKITNVNIYKECLDNITIPKIFIIDMVPQKHKEIYLKEKISSHFPFTSLSKHLQNLLYDQCADGFIFYSKLDQDLFKDYYIVDNKKPSTIIPPSLGKKEDIKIKFKDFKPNKLIGTNCSPSISNGFLNFSNIMGNLKDYSLDIYGAHGREDVFGEGIINDLTSTLPNINFKGKLKNTKLFFSSHHIYYSAVIYDSFDYFTFLSILNGMVPILTENTGTSSFFKSYPFQSNGTPESIKYNINLITNTHPDYLKEILTNTLKGLLELNDSLSKEKYYTFLNGF